MNTPVTGHWAHIQSPKSQVLKDSVKGLLATIGTGLTIASFLSLFILAVTSTGANAASSNALSNAKSGSLLVKNIQIFTCIQINFKYRPQTQTVIQNFRKDKTFKIFHCIRQLQKGCRTKCCKIVFRKYY